MHSTMRGIALGAKIRPVIDPGWSRSHRAWTEFMDQGDPNRTHLLDPVMLRLCGEMAGKRVLDLGCGEGRFLRMLDAVGAVPTGIDPTMPLLQESKRRSAGVAVARAVGERLPFSDGVFDLVVSYVSLVDIADYREAIFECARVLASGGRFVASNVSAFTTADGRWIRDADGAKLAYAFDRYGEEFATQVSWREIEVLQHHRPLSSVLTACLQAGLRLESFEEPQPSAEALIEQPILEDFRRMPNFYAMAWTKE